jgi:antitoxin HigA-1
MASSSISLSKGTTLRLARYFGTDAQSWLNLRLSYDLKIAEAELKARIEREVEEMAT